MNMFDQNQKRTLRIALAAIVVGFLMSMFGGCDGSNQAIVEQTDAGTVVGRTDAGVPLTIPAAPFPYNGTAAADYTASGVTAALGRNICASGIPMGWEPGLSLCWPATQADGRGGICGVLPASATPPCAAYAPGTCGPMPACGTYAPGTLRVWSMDDPRYSYKGDPASFGNAGTGGYICLPNVAPYVIPC